MRFVVIDETRATTVDAKLTGTVEHLEDHRIRLAPAELEAALGWTVKPEGLCRGAVCVPTRRRPDLVTADGVDLVGVADLLDRPLVFDADESAVVVCASAAERATRLASLDAPDFTLADLDGRPHSLSDYRGKKVLLVAYASW